MRQKSTLRSASQIRVALLAAVAGVFSLAPGALAQNRIDTSAPVQANPLVGSNGQNYQTPSFGAQYRAAIQNVGTTSVTNGFGFRGAHFNGVDLGTGYSDPFAFRGLLAGQGIDQFIANSTGVPTEANPFASSGNIATGARPAYGGANTVVTPPGFARSSNSPSYVPAKPQSLNPVDTRLGDIDYNSDVQSNLAQPAEAGVGGQVTTQVNPSQIWTTSTLYGVQPWQANQPDQTGQDIFATQANLQNGQSNFLSPNQVASMRAQLGQSYSNTAGGISGRALSPEGEPLKPLLPGQVAPYGSQQALRPTGEARGSQVSVGQAPGSQAPGSQAGSSLSNSLAVPPAILSPEGGDYSTNQSTRQQLPNNLPTPSQQSAQYFQLQQRVNEYKKSAPKTDEEANRRFQEILRLRKQVEGAGAANPNNPNPEEPSNTGTKGPHGMLTAPGIGGGGVAIPSAPSSSRNGGSVNITIPQPSAPPEEGVAAPIQIESYANGIGSKDFSNLIASGEAAVKKGQFDKGISIFDQAVAVAPNNSMFLVARANAELGGGYYNKADGDLHDAYISDDTMLMSQYDLDKHLGAKRVQTMVDDLKHIAEDSPENETPAFLLAYINYNSHHSADAVQWLNEADKRSKGNDPAIQKMKRLWVFEQAPAAPATKPSAAK